MSATLNITLVQSHLKWDDPIANRSHLSILLESLNQTDLIVLPEMFTTAFCMEGEAETMEGESVHWMLQLAKEKGAAICGSLNIEEEGKRHNRFVWATPGGELAFYDKRHLFSLMEEEKHFSAGSERTIIHYKGWNICPQICYDLRFPVFSRNDSAYDLLIYVANWPVRRIVAWDKLLQARAIENQSYVVGVNRVGVDTNSIVFNGHSAVYDAFGETLVFLGEEEKVVTLTIDKAIQESIRKKLPFLKDRDGFTVSK